MLCLDLSSLSLLSLLCFAAYGCCIVSHSFNFACCRLAHSQDSKQAAVADPLSAFDVLMRAAREHTHSDPAHTQTETEAHTQTQTQSTLHTQTPAQIEPDSAWSPRANKRAQYEYLLSGTESVAGLVFATAVRYRGKSASAKFVFREGDRVRLPSGASAFVAFLAVDKRRHYTAVTHAHSADEATAALDSFPPSKLTVTGRADQTLAQELQAIKRAYIERKRQAETAGKQSTSTEGSNNSSKSSGAAGRQGRAAHSHTTETDADVAVLRDELSVVRKLMETLSERGLVFEDDASGAESDEEEEPKRKRKSKPKEKGKNKAKSKGKGRAKAGGGKKAKKGQTKTDGNVSESSAAAQTLLQTLKTVQTLTRGLQRDRAREREQRDRRRTEHSASRSRSHSRKRSSSRSRRASRSPSRSPSLSPTRDHRRRGRSRERHRSRDRDRDRKKSSSRSAKRSRSRERSRSKHRLHLRSRSPRSRRHR